MKKNLLTVLILALLVVNIVLTCVLMFSVIGTNQKTAQLVSNIATVMNLELTLPGEEEVEEPVSLADTVEHKLANSMTIPLASEVSGEGSSKERYIMFDLALMMNKEHEDYETYGATIGEREGMIEDVITTIVSSHTETECRNDLEGIKEEILEELQELFQSDFIYKIGITSVKFG